MISLSSMESEFFALQHVAQEMSCLGRIVAGSSDHFMTPVWRRFQGFCFQIPNHPLLHNMDIQAFAIEWWKRRVEDQKLILELGNRVWKPSDLPTKCFGASAFGYYGDSLGFEVFFSRRCLGKSQAERPSAVSEIKVRIAAWVTGHHITKIFTLHNIIGNFFKPSAVLAVLGGTYSIRILFMVKFPTSLVFCFSCKSRR